jgi:hypothetical protein
MARVIRRASTLCALLAVAALALALAPPARAQGGDRDFGKESIIVPERTDAGVWDGTWSFVSRDNRMVLWLRTQNGKPELKLQYQSLANAEAFETDWTGRSSYYLAGEPATFECVLTQRDANTLQGNWNWKLEFEDSGRVEVGTFTIYRAGDGRQLVMRFDKLERQLRRRDEVKRYQMNTSWTFTKASKRILLWDEVY